MGLVQQFEFLLLTFSMIVMPIFASQVTPFCKSVYLFCNSSTVVSSQTYPAIAKKMASFKKSDIIVGGHITTSNVHKESSEALLSADLWEHLSPVPEFLNSSSGAALAESVLGLACGFGKETVEMKICPSPVAGMIELATQEEGSHHLDILKSSNNGLAKLAEKKIMLVTHVALRKSARSQTSIVCREVAGTDAGKKNPSICYTMEGVENIQATMRSEDGEDEVTVGMQCYEDDGEEGERWCEWVKENTLVGVVKREDEEEMEEEGEMGSEWMKGMKLLNDLKASLEVKAESMKHKIGNAKDEMEDEVSNLGAALKVKVENVEDKMKEAAASPLGAQIVEAVGDQAIQAIQNIPENGFKASMANAAANAAGTGVKLAINAIPVP